VSGSIPCFLVGLGSSIMTHSTVALYFTAHG
jgi:hypothetical protein